jgi:hypothetical protein
MNVNPAWTFNGTRWTCAQPLACPPPPALPPGCGPFFSPPLIDAPVDGNLYGRENAAWQVIPPPGPTLGGLVSIVDFGGNGNGVFDNLAAYNAAVAHLRATSPGYGTVYFPPGVWASSGPFMITASGIHLQGAGMTATTLLGLVEIVSLLTGTGTEGGTVTYPINPPVQGSNTITTTNATDSGNFSAGNTIFISGPLHSTAFWYPSWTTTVLSVNTSTGVITLTETLPFGGSGITLVQNILNYVTDVKISDLTINIPAGATTGGLQATVAGNVVLARIASRTMNPASPTTRHSYVSLAGVRGGHTSDSLFVGGYADFLGCNDYTISDNIINQGVLVLDGGTQNCTVLNNFMTDIALDGSPNNGMTITGQNNQIINNIIHGQSADAAILLSNSDPAIIGGHVVVGNIIRGTNTSSPTGIISSAQNCVIAGNSIDTVAVGMRFTSSAGNMIAANTFVNIPSPNNNNIIFDAASGNSPITNDYWLTLASGATTANASLASLFYISNSTPTNFTGFTGGINGQIVTLLIADANTTLVYSGTFVLRQIGNYNPGGLAVIRFIFRNGVWYEIARSNNSTAAANYYRGLIIGPGSGGLTISSIAAPAAAAKGTLGIDTNNLVFYTPGLTTAPAQSVTGTAATITSGSATIAATGTCTLTLPTAAVNGTWLHLLSTTAQVVQSAAANVIPLAGGAAGTAIFPASAPHWCKLQYNGTNWLTLAGA